MANMHNESGRHEGYSSGTSNRLWEYTERLTQRWKALAPKGFPKEWSFLGLVTISVISPGVNVARTKTRSGGVGWLEKRLALGLVRGWLA